MTERQNQNALKQGAVFTHQPELVIAREQELGRETLLGYRHIFTFDRNQITTSNTLDYTNRFRVKSCVAQIHTEVNSSVFKCRKAESVS